MHYTRLRRHGRLDRVNLTQGETCAYPKCRKAAHAKGFCSTHYQQSRPELEMTWRLLRSRSKGAYPPAWKDYDAFCADVGERPSAAHQLRRVDKSKPWGIDNFVWLEPIGVSFAEDGPYYQWIWNLRNTYDLTPADCEQIIASQKGLCPACLEPLGYFGPSSRKEATAVVEHDHDSEGKPLCYSVRGIMHRKCNSGMGLLNDDPATLRRAADHLEAHQRRKAAGICIVDEITNGGA